MLLLHTSTSEPPPTATVCLPLPHRNQCLSTTQTTPANQLHAHSLPARSLWHAWHSCTSLQLVCLAPTQFVPVLVNLPVFCPRLLESASCPPVSEACLFLTSCRPLDSREKPDRLLSPTTIACLRPSRFSYGGSSATSWDVEPLFLSWGEIQFPGLPELSG